MNATKAIFKTFFLSLCIIANIHFAFAQTTGGIIPNGQNVFLDNNGKPLSGGKVFFYTGNVGSTVPKTTFQDINLTTPNTNPVILDASGRPHSGTGLWGTGNYRQVVQDKNNNLIWDVLTSAAGSGSSGGGGTATGDGDLVGTIKPWAGMTAPNQYMFAYGAQISRTTFSALFTAITSAQSVFCNSGSPILNGLGDTTNFWIGMTVEVSCVPAGVSTVLSKTSNSITLNTNANVTLNTNATFFPWGNGNGVNTFTLPDLRGVVPMGNNIMGGVASSNMSDVNFGSQGASSSGALGGSQSEALLPSNAPNVSNTFVGIQGTATSTGNFANGLNLSTSNAVSPGGGSSYATSETTATVNSTFTPTGTISSLAGGIAVSSTIVAAGSAYPVSSSVTLTVVGGTCSIAPQFTVSTSGGGALTGTPTLLTAGRCSVAPSNPVATTSSGTGTGGTLNVIYSAVPFSLVQPSKTINYIVKVTPDANSATANGVTDINGMTGSIGCGAGLTCTGNIINVGLNFGSLAFQNSVLAMQLPLGVPTNTRSAYTSVNPMATTDCGKTVALGGSAFFTFTVNAASGYNASCAVIITNEDNVCPANGASTCRGKNIAINGYASFILWPGQTFTLINQNNVWQYDQPGRWLPLVGMTWHVNHATGSDTGDGLGTSGTGEFATLQRCVNVMESLIDFGQADAGPTCQNDNETFTENNVVHTHPLTGYHVISINGNTASPSSVVWQVSGSGNVGTQCRDGGNSIVTGFNFVSTGTANFFINGGQLGVCDFGSIIFGTNSSGYDLFQTPGGSMNFFGGTLSITGSMTGFVLMEGEGHVLIDGATVTMPNALTFTNFFQLSGPSLVSATSMVFSGPGSGAGSTGRQWLIDHTSNLQLTGSTIPGNSVGIYNCTPIVNVFTTGTNAAFALSTCNGVLPATLEFELQGGGGGGAGSGTTPIAASNGNPSCLSLSGVACTSPVYQAGGGLAGTSTVGNVVAGGTVSGSVSCDDAISGASVGSASNQVNTPGSPGGSSFYGGAGAHGFSTAGADAAANSGSGGGGGGVGAGTPGGGGGSPGAWCRKMITNPVAAYVYTVGPLANGGTAGTGGFAGGKGAAGRMKFIQRWQ